LAIVAGSSPNPATMDVELDAVDARWLSFLGCGRASCRFGFTSTSLVAGAQTMGSMLGVVGAGATCVDDAVAPNILTTADNGLASGATRCCGIPSAPRLFVNEPQKQ